MIGIWNLLFPEKSKLCSRRESGAKASKAGGLGVTPTPTLGPFFILEFALCPGPWRGDLAGVAGP